MKKDICPGIAQPEAAAEEAEAVEAVVILGVVAVGVPLEAEVEVPEVTVLI